MSLLERIEDEFISRDVTTIKHVNVLNQLLEKEKVFMSSLNNEQRIQYLELESLQHKLNEDEITQALSYGCKYVINLIKEMILLK